MCWARKSRGKLVLYRESRGGRPMCWARESRVWNPIIWSQDSRVGSPIILSRDSRGKIIIYVSALLAKRSQQRGGA